MFVKSTVSMLAALACFSILGAPSSRADDAPLDEERPPKVLSMVLLGDSYSAGNGLGVYDLDPEEADGDAGEEKAYRSSLNWASVYRDQLRARGVAARLTNLAHSGSTTENVIKQQVSKIPADTDLVMLTIGGNDAEFGQVVRNCFALHYRHPIDCKNAVENARKFVRDSGPGGLEARTKAVLDEISFDLRENKDRYNVQIVLVGYPNLLISIARQYYVLRECKWGEWFSCEDFIEYNAGEEILRAAREMAEAQKRAVTRWNQSIPPYPQITPKARYIDSIPRRFRNHEPHPSVALRNEYRWINEFFETAGHHSGAIGSPTTSLFSSDEMEWYHPNIIGHQEIGKVLMEEVGIPRVARQALPPDATADTEPDAETPKPMLAWIDGPYAHEIGKPLTLEAGGSYSANGKIVKYEWDLDGDKKFDRTTTAPSLTYTWRREFLGDISLRITTATGASAVGSTRAMITNDGDSTPYARDNCPEVNNHGQTDYDKDGIGDLCDPTPGYPTEDRPGVGEWDPTAPTPTPKPSPSPSKTATPSPSASPTKSPSPTPTMSPSPKPSKTPSAPPTPSVSPSVTASPSPTLSPSEAPSPSPSASPTVEPSVTAEPTVSPSESVSPLPTETPSASPTESSPSATAAPTVTEPPTMSPEPTGIPVPTVSPTSNPPVPPSPTSAPAPTTPQPTIPEPPSVPFPSRPVSPDPSRPRPGLPNTGA